MFDIFKPVIDFLEFIVNGIQTLITMVGMALSTFTSLFALLPVQVSVPAGVLLVVCVLYKILGRESVG